MTKKLIRDIFIESHVYFDKKEIIREMPEFSDKDKDLANDENFDAPEDARLVKSYPTTLPGGDKGVVELYQYNNSPGSKEVILKLPTGEGIGVLSFDAHEESDLPFPTVMFSAVKEKYRGKGFSKILYNFVIKMYKGIISDATLTGEEGYGSFHTWQSLSKTYNAYVVGVDNIVAPRNNFTKDIMGSHHERFMVTLHTFDYNAHNARMRKLHQLK